MKAVFLLLSLLLLTSCYAMNPPAIVWMKFCFEESLGRFYHVHEAFDGGYIVAGWHLLQSNNWAETCLYKLDQNGNLLWFTGAEGYSADGQAGFWVEELADSSFIVTGICGFPDEPTSAVMLAKFDCDGNQIWTKAYDDPETNDQGNCVIALDDGYAIAGDRGGDAWIIRTDLQGDSLWSVNIDEYHNLSSRRVLQVGDALLVYMSGQSPIVVALSSEDGQLLWEFKDFPGYFATVYLECGDVTLSSTDSGYTFVSPYWPRIVHTDSLCNILWSYEIPSLQQPYSYSVETTMDGGYIYGGVNTPNPDDPTSLYTGMVVKYDSEGNEHWRDYVYECIDLFCIRQLSSGGYIACAALSNKAMLLRYAPETGIEGESIAGGVTITSLAPNPFYSVLEVQFSVPECSQIDLSVYDLSGRLTDMVAQDVFPAGEYSAQWVPEGIPSGCYLVRLSTPGSSFVRRRCVYIE